MLIVASIRCLKGVLYGSETGDPKTMRIMHIFISHEKANSNITRSLAEALEAAREDVTTFIASRPGDIRADEDWLKGIERALQEADAYIIILTPESVMRPWVNFESGAAWFFRRQLIFVRI